MSSTAANYPINFAYRNAFSSFTRFNGKNYYICLALQHDQGTVVNIPGGWCSIAYSPYGRHIISGSKDSAIRIWDAETGTAVGKPLEGIPRVWSPPTLPMGSTSSLDLGTVQFEFGMPRLVPQSVGLWSEKLQASCQLLALQIGSTLIQDLITTLPVCRNQLLLNRPPLLLQFMSISFHTRFDQRFRRQFTLLGTSILS